jgi:hypothetical protein
MNRFVVSTILLTSLTVAAHCQPKIEVVGNAVRDLGTLYNTGAHVKETFNIKNAGDQALHISGVRTSCGCTAAIPSDSTVQPGKQTQIEVDFNPTGYRGDVSKEIYVMTNDPSNQMTTLKITMHISYALQSTPDFVLFQNAKVGKADTSAVTLTNTSGETIRITKVETSSEDVKSHVHIQKLKPGDSTLLELYLVPEKSGPLYGEVFVNTDSKLQPKLAIRYYAGVN